LGHVNRFFYNNNGVNANESQTFPVADDNPQDSSAVDIACFKESEGTRNVTLLKWKVRGDMDVSSPFIINGSARHLQVIDK
jgi:hypothetical protein